MFKKHLINGPVPTGHKQWPKIHDSQLFKLASVHCTNAMMLHRYNLIPNHQHMNLNRKFSYNPSTNSAKGVQFVQLTP